MIETWSKTHGVSGLDPIPESLGDTTLRFGVKDGKLNSQSIRSEVQPSSPRMISGHPESPSASQKLRNAWRVGRFIVMALVAHLRRALRCWPTEVGTPVARRPPRRSRRAELPHRAPQRDAPVERRLGLVGSWWTISCMLWGALSSGPWRRRFGDDGRGQLPAFPGSREGLPGVALPLTPAVQPFEHEAFDFVRVTR